MFKTIFLSFFLFIAFLSCQNSVESAIYEKDSLQWLKVKIESLAVHPDYVGSKVYRYEWNSNFVYHIMIPISSCAYCELYNGDGGKIQFTNDEMFSDFLKNKKNEVLIWERKFH
ncbi:MAG: hypothetical protein KKF62_01775 [Bacteroidetes bacterium]|nr:hypothetical protein [Bacteroidota bacterium]MBU1116339.1 hypothetical protein [Bacteroidota bacterium]MBU1796912.1 hypothetical protein [Bacteroidota bacterium]